MVLNGGPQYTFTEATSFFVSCKDQDEADYFWDALSAGGEEPQCGWLKDRFGLSWQIVPTALGEMLGDSDREKAGREMNTMLQMKKIDIAKSREAFESVARA